MLRDSYADVGPLEKDLRRAAFGLQAGRALITLLALLSQGSAVAVMPLLLQSTCI